MREQRLVMRKERKLRSVGMLSCVAAGVIAMSLQAGSFILPTGRELYGTGDFDGDGQSDVVIVDCATGKYRLGYGQADGTIAWVDHRKTEVEGITGLAIGQVLQQGKDALVLVSADQNVVLVVDASNREEASEPVEIEFLSLGPNSVAALDIGGEGNTPLEDLVIASIYNDPVPTRLSLFHSTGKEFKLLTEVDDQAGRLEWANTWRTKDGKEWLIGLWRKNETSTLRVLDFRSGKPVEAACVGNLPAKVVYGMVTDANGQALLALVEPGQKTVRLYRLSERNGKCQLGKVASVELAQPVHYLVGVKPGKESLWAAVAADDYSVSLIGIQTDGTARVLKQVELDAGIKCFGVATVGSQVVLFTGEDYEKAASQYQFVRLKNGQWTEGAPADLPTLKETDEWTIPQIYKQIIATLEKEGIRSAADMKPYTNTIPGTRVKYVMVPVPGGEFLMGSPENEPGRRPDEGPQHKVYVDPFWIGKYEVTWNEYELFMYPEDEKKIRQTVGGSNPYLDKIADGVARPSKPYAEMSFGMGKNGYPAISMTQHAANKYCQWLSAKTGHFYRLPTEAEWEYACRAGTTTAYSFGNDPKKLGEYAWYEENSDFKYHKVGTKKPNPWGIHDMHGNVWEWCLDQYLPDYTHVLNQYRNPWVKPTKPYPIVVRGGSYDDPAEDCRSAARRGSDPSWKMRDPQLPKSIWWFTDAPWVGIRIVRPLKVPPEDQIKQYWYNGVEYDE